MSRTRARRAVLAFAAAVLALALVPSGAAVAGASGGGASGGGASGGGASGAGSGAELSVTDRLADRRTVTTGDRMYQVGAADGTYPATGWHVRGEMGGFWTPPVKLLDGLWFGVDGHWLRGERYTSGRGYTRMDLRGADGSRVRRVDVVPDGVRAGLVGLTFDGPRRVELAVQAHSELMSAYPWGWTTPSQQEFNLPDKSSFDGRNLVFRETGTPDVENAPRHDYAAVVGSTLTPSAHRLGRDMRGPQHPAVVCPEEDPAPDRCDDGPFGRGTGGELTYDIDVPAGGRTVWFAVAGSDDGRSRAYGELARALRDPAGAWAGKLGARRAVDARTSVRIPGDPLLERSVAWSKQNLADSVQEARDLRLFASREGKQYPAPVGRLARARWLGAGWPDYPWLFGTDGEYTAYAAVAAGEFEAIKDHLSAFREISDVVNDRSGKVVHEVTPDGQVYFGANDDPGNTDETAKFPSAVALVWRWTGDDGFRDAMYDFTRRNMRYVVGLDADGDGWPEGLGNVERPGMGEEKLDVAVYTIRGLRDLADLARSKHDRATARWATSEANKRQQAFERTWWHGGDAKAYADSLDGPDNGKVFQRHWIGVTPMEATSRSGPLASRSHAATALAQRERDCYTGAFGLYHTGTGPTTAEGGNRGPTCDSATSTVQSERATYSLGTAVMAVAEGNYGRLTEQRPYLRSNARIQLDPAVWETPGAMPEIAPSPDFEANIDQSFLSRSSNLQAWGAYGILWPVVHHHLGVTPDLGNDRVSVIPQLPKHQPRMSATDLTLGTGTADVSATRSTTRLTTNVTTNVDATLTLGAVLPPNTTPTSVTLNDHPAQYTQHQTPRGTEIRVRATTPTPQHLTITLT